MSEVADPLHHEDTMTTRIDEQLQKWRLELRVAASMLQGVRLEEFAILLTEVSSLVDQRLSWAGVKKPGQVAPYTIQVCGKESTDGRRLNCVLPPGHEPEPCAFEKQKGWRKGG